MFAAASSGNSESNHSLKSDPWCDAIRFALANAKAVCCDRRWRHLRSVDMSDFSRSKCVEGFLAVRSARSPPSDECCCSH